MPRQITGKQLAARRALVLELKAESENQLAKKFYIKHGKVVSVEK